jgi:hypothetical protein
MKGWPTAAEKFASSTKAGETPQFITYRGASGSGNCSKPGPFGVWRNLQK